MRGPPADRDAMERLRFGVVNLDKPPGPSAHQVAGWIRDMVDDAVVTAGGESVGRAAHGGTLDPKVTGCLPVLLGEATRLSGVLLEGVKEYVAVLELHGPPPSDLEAVLEEFESDLYQKPPRKSAVSRRLRTRTVHDLDLLDLQDRMALLRVRCESGTYVRKLCHDLGLALGTGGHMGDLRRVATGPFDDTDLVTMHDLADALAYLTDGESDSVEEVVSPAERALEGIPRATIAPSAAAEVANGAPVYAPGVLDVESSVARGELVACYTPDDAVVCLGELAGDPAAERGEVISLKRVLV